MDVTFNYSSVNAVMYHVACYPSSWTFDDQSGSLLKQQIPIRTFAQWDEATPTSLVPFDLAACAAALVLLEGSETDEEPPEEKKSASVLDWRRTSKDPFARQWEQILTWVRMNPTRQWCRHPSGTPILVSWALSVLVFAYPSTGYPQNPGTGAPGT